MIKIALIAPRGSSLQRIRTVLANPLVYSVREFHSMLEIKDGLERFPFEVLITRFAHFEKSQSEAILRLRARFKDVPLITLAPDIHPSLKAALKSIPGHKLIDDNRELGDLPSVIKNMFELQATKQRLHSRGKRSGEAEVVDSGGAWQAKARFLDFAQMGARLVIESEQSITPKARVRVLYRSSSDTSRLHNIESQVVWVKPIESGVSSWLGRARQEIGVRFIAAL